MYEYSDLEKLLSPSANDVLSEEGVFDIYKTEAENIITGYTGLTAEVLTTTCKAPFVLVLEYLVLNRLANTSPDYKTKVEDGYATALRMLDKIIERNITAPTTRVGTITSDYTEY